MSSNIIIDALHGSSAYIKKADSHRDYYDVNRVAMSPEIALMREQNALLRANHALLVAILSEMTEVS